MSRRPKLLWTLWSFALFPLVAASLAGCLGSGSGSSWGPSRAPAYHAMAPPPRPPREAAPVHPSPWAQAQPDLAHPVVAYAPAARLLTAGMVADTDRRAEFLEYLDRELHALDWLALDLSRRLRVRVLDALGQPVNDALVIFEDPATGRTLGRTHADGVLDWFPQASPGQGPALVSVRARVHQQEAAADVILDAYAGDAEVTLWLDTIETAPSALDLAFLIDVTGSMEDELRYVNAELGDIVQ
jgi:hypothetical protein